MIPRNPNSIDSLLARLHIENNFVTRSKSGRTEFESPNDSIPVAAATRRAPDPRRIGIDFAENRARAAGTLVVTMMYGIDLWRQAHRMRAAGELAHVLVLLPFTATSWSIGAAGIGLELGGVFLLQLHRASVPLAWPIRGIGSLLRSVARGIAWCGDRVV